MCKFCEPSKHGICKPMAFNKVGTFKIPLVDIRLNENIENQFLMLVHYDENEPLQLAINFCPICGRELQEKTNENPSR